MRRNLLLLILAIILVGCKEQESANIDLGINNPELSMQLMEKTQLTISNPEYANSSDLVWTSRNPEVASVSKTGEVTAIAPGTTEIYAFVSGLNAVRAVSKITVIKDVKSTLKIEAQDRNISVGDTLKAKYSYTPQLTAVLSAVDMVTSDSIGQKVVDASINEKTGTLQVIALIPGVVRIELFNKADKKVTASIDIEVQQSDITTFRFKNVINDIFEIKAGEASQLKLEILPLTSNYRNIYWKSSNPKAVSVDQAGNITAVAPNGYAKISASTPSRNVATCDVKIIAVGGDLKFAEDTIVVTTINKISQEIPLSLSSSPTLASVNVNVDATYVPKEGQKTNITLKNNTTAIFSYTQSQVGSARIVAQSTKNGKMISDTCIVIIQDISDDLVKCKPTYSTVELGAKTVFTAKIANFTATNLTLNKVELIHVKPMFDKNGKPISPEITSIKIKDNLNLEVKAISPISVDFEHVMFDPIKVVTPREQYQVRYTYTVGAATNTVSRTASVDNGAAFSPAL